MLNRLIIPLLGVCSCSVMANGLAIGTSSINEFATLSLEELSQLDVVVSSVSRKPQKLSSTASAVFVIDQEDIRRSGVTSIPEALRMAPGIQVARIDSSRWAISARGDNGRFADKLLVMIDGRSVYNPLFSGVYWDVQDYLLEDIERIEVIRGPGATVWGANAVNGVINIITREASQTQGWLLNVGAGTEEEGFFGLRYGGSHGDSLDYRVYLKGFQRDSAPDFNGVDSLDESEAQQAGFRFDWQAGANDSFTIQGDVRDGEPVHEETAFSLVAPFATLAKVEEELDNANILGRWHRSLAVDSEFELQTYYERAERSSNDVTGLTYQRYEVFDVDFQHHYKPMAKHDLVWGGGYRRIDDDFVSGGGVQFIPGEQSVEYYNLFFQNEISLFNEGMLLTLGSKFEDNPYTGLEIQPNLRAHWQFDDDYSMWAAVSRAVRTPNRSSEDIIAEQLVVPGAPPQQLVVMGNSQVESEKLIAYEFGFRGRVSEMFNYDLAVFYHDYDDLVTFQRGTPVLQAVPVVHVDVPVNFRNNEYGESYGVEAALQWRPVDWAHFDLAYSFVDMQIHTQEVPGGIVNEDEEGSSPEHQLSLRSSFDLSDQLDLDFWLRYVDDLPALQVEDYTTLDIRLAWRPVKGLELSLVGQNLLDSEHEEFVGEVLSVTATQAERGVYAKVSWQFGE